MLLMLSDPLVQGRKCIVFVTPCLSRILKSLAYNKVTLVIIFMFIPQTVVETNIVKEGIKQRKHPLVLMRCMHINNQPELVISLQGGIDFVIFHLCADHVHPCSNCLVSKPHHRKRPHSTWLRFSSTAPAGDLTQLGGWGTSGFIHFWNRSGDLMLLDLWLHRFLRSSGAAAASHPAPAPAQSLGSLSLSPFNSGAPGPLAFPALTASPPLLPHTLEPTS
mmetsp:Transcript_31765/g.49701  ORF Transcript_31765/g.49701 Transcript_31765/m.49701 type:complete len:220 (+) Transcript_31765:1648-2307(+)